jgi:hypothetical protein
MLDERTLVMFLWDSFDRNIIRDLYRNGLSPKVSSLQAVNYGGHWNTSNAQTMSSFSSSASNRVDKNFAGSYTIRLPHNGPRMPNNNFRGTSIKAPIGNSLPPKIFQAHPNRLPEVQRNEYRAAGRCFECREMTHKVKDCPKEF